MLRNRSRNLTTKQSLMADHNSVPSPRSNQTKRISSFFGSPRFFNGFFSKGSSNISDAETVMSPTSILLDSKTVSNFGNPFGYYYDQNMSRSQKTSSTENKHFNEKLDSKGICVALIDSTNDEKNHDSSNFTKPKLKIQIPPSGISPTQSPKSSADFGIKTRSRNLSPFGGLNPNISTGGLSLSEMELSEDYTCVISHGPNPKTTHIYDNCILESCCGVVALSELKKEFNLNSPSKSFLSFCHTCNKNLGDGKDIYMYRLVHISLIFLRLEIFIAIQSYC